MYRLYGRPGSGSVVVEAILEVSEHRDRIRGLAIESEPPLLRHFSARFRQL